MFDPTFARAGVLWTAIIEFIQTAAGSVAVSLESFVARQLIRNPQLDAGQRKDRKSTRLNSSHVSQSRMPSSA